MKKKKLYLPALLLLFLPGVCCFGQEQEFLKGIVSITDPTFNSSGTGIIIARKQNRVYVLTAKHVVDYNPEMVYKVRFTEDVYPYTASVLNYSDELDIAVLTVHVPISVSGAFLPHNFYQDDLKGLKSNKTKVTAVGYPIASPLPDVVTETIKNTSTGVFNVDFSNTNITSGFSGGPLLDKKGKRILGIITDVTDGANFATAVRIDKIMEELNRWSVPTDYLPYKKEYNKWSIPLLVLSAGATSVGYFEYDRKVDDNNDILKKYSDPIAILNRQGGQSHEDITKNTKKQRDLRTASYSLAGLSLLTCIGINIDWKKNKKEPPKNKILWPEDISSKIYFSPTGVQFGFAMKL